MTASPLPQATFELTEPHLESTPIRIKDILIATDFSEQATAAAKVAAGLARTLDAKLHVLHAVPLQIYTADSTPMLQHVDVEIGQRSLHTYAAGIPHLKSLKHEEIVLSATPTDAISMMVEEKKIGLVVVGSHGRSGLKKVVLGSVAESAVRHLHCPVLVVGPQCDQTRGSLKSILFAADMLYSSLRPAQYAAAIARQTGASLTIAHVFPASDARSAASEYRERVTHTLRQLAPQDLYQERRIHIETAVGAPGEELLAIAARARSGLIVMGVHEHGMMADHAPWATIAQVVRTAHCPVLAVQAHIV
ncbi:MAG TPA: universal stress protein [Acidobacteriaceae bacterium]|nr:universal stress protein [Acidobacteriaceae bacterium]